MEFIAIDIGSGLTKYMHKAEKGFFPSAVGVEYDGKGFSLGIKPNEYIEFGGKTYLTGDSALGTLKPSDIETSTSKNWCKNQAQLVLAMSVIALLYPDGFDGEIGLALGLPIKIFSQAHEAYKDLFVGTHAFKAGNTDYKVTIKKDSIDVLPQVLGLHFKNLFSSDMDAEEFAESKFAYIDPGTQTIGFAVIDNNVFSRHLSNGVDKGMFHLSERVAKALDQTYGYKAINKADILRGFRRGKITVFNEGKKEQIDMLDFSQNMVKEVFGSILDDVSKLWEQARDMPVLVSSGGGEYIINEVKRCFPHAELLSPVRKRSTKSKGEANVDKNQAIFDVVEGFHHYYSSVRAA